MIFGHILTLLQVTDLVYSSASVCGWFMLGKGHRSERTLEWGYVQMGCVHMEVCLLGNPLAWSGSLIDEVCSHIQQLTPDDSSLTLTGWHWSCTIYFSPSLVFMSQSLSQLPYHSLDVWGFFLPSTCLGRTTTTKKSVTVTLPAFSFDISKTKHRCSALAVFEVWHISHAVMQNAHVYASVCCVLRTPFCLQSSTRPGLSSIYTIFQQQEAYRVALLSSGITGMQTRL